MKPLQYLQMLVLSYNPNQYGKLIDRPAKQFFAYACYTIITTLLLFTILLIPTTLIYLNNLPARTANVQQFTVSATVQSDNPITILDYPRIIINPTTNATRTGDITLTNDGILYPQYIIFGTTIIPWSDIDNLKAPTPTHTRALITLITFLLPSIIFWVFTASILAIILLLIMLIILSYTIPRFFKYQLTMKESTRLSILTMPSILLFSLALSPLGATALFWVGILLTVTLYTIGVVLMSELAIEAKRKI